MRQDWFPTPIWHFQHENAEKLNKILRQAISEAQNSDPQGLSISNVLGWHSTDDLHQKSECAEFVIMVNNALAEVTQELAWDLQQVKPTITNCWAIVNPKNAFNVLHQHANSILSGVYYLDVPEDSGNLYFHDPRHSGQMLVPPYQQITPWTLGKLIYKPISGMLVIFPSWVWHGVEVNLSEQNRISLSFNVSTIKP
jgi:uncharacterized protein (TIGR02466 family)